MTSRAQVTINCPFCGELVEGLSFEMGGFEGRSHCPHCREFFSVIVVFKAVPLNPKESEILNLLDGRGYESFFNPWETAITEALISWDYVEEDSDGFLNRTPIGCEVLNACNS